MTTQTQTDTDPTDELEDVAPVLNSEPRPLLRLGVTILAALVAVFLLYTAHALFSQNQVDTAACAKVLCE